MKQYNKAWVPNEHTKYAPDESGMLILSGGLDELENVIVLTLEELRDIWSAAQDRASALEMGEPGDTKMFETYLTSKGIKIQ